MGKYAWEPYGKYLYHSRVRKFMDAHGIKTAEELIARSVSDINWFWSSAMDFLGVEWFRRFHTLYDDSKGMPWTKWFLGGKTNITHNCLDRHVERGWGGNTALIFERDNGTSYRVTYATLHNLVKKLARAMKLYGIKKGDRIAMCMPISPEAVAVMLAAFKIGAVCMQPASRISAHEIVESILPGAPKLFFMNDGYERAGKVIKLDETFHEVRRRVCSDIVVFQRFWKSFEHENAARYASWDSFVWQNGHHNFPQTEALDAEHPALILYSSGTTGKSKIIIHTHGGILAQVPKEIGLAFDCRENDVFYWFTNIGWMMAPWEIIGALFFGATVVLYEGTHLYPSAHRMFELIKKHKITIFGFTPSAMIDLAGIGEDFSHHDLSSLRILGSTGKVFHPKIWEWYSQTFGKGRLPIMNISGGTEIIGCLVSPLPVMPQNPGTVGGPGLGMDVDVVDENGSPARGSPGYLVCKKPAPSMTRGFLGENERYLETYFPWGHNLWVHGDIAEIGELTSEAIAAMRQWVGKTYDPLARPDEIHVVSGLPINLAAKVLLRLVRMAYAGEMIADVSKIINPQFLEEIRALGERMRQKS